VVVPAWEQGGVGAWVVCSGAQLAALYLDYSAHRDLFDVQGAADDRVRRDAWLLGLLFLPNLLDLAAVRGWSEFVRLLGRKIRNLLVALVLVGAFCFPFHALGLDRVMLNVPNVLPPLPAGGCVWWRAGAGGARPAPGC
jgi:hypothetical protein